MSATKEREPKYPVTAPSANTAGTAVSIATTDDYASDAGAGMEGLGIEEKLVPIFRILHYQCPEITESDGRFIPGAKSGMILNTATMQVYDGKAGVLFVPAFRTHAYLEFLPRGQSGGGFRGQWEPTDPRLPALRQAQGQFQRLTLANGNELTETWSLIGLAAPLNAEGNLASEAELQTANIGFSSKQIRKYRQIMARIDSLVGSPPKFPMWAFAWVLRTQPESNAKGNFFGWNARLRGDSPATAQLRANDPLYLAARELHKQMKAGTVKADYEGAASGVADDSEDPNAPPF